MFGPIIIRQKLFSHLNYSSSSQFLFSLFTRRISCWKCGCHFTGGSQCTSCKALQEPSKINYFDLLNVDVTYDVDVKALVPQYHRLQIQYHPDKQSGENEENRRKSEEFSIAVNRAYSTLTDPMERALYILKLNGISIGEITSEQNPELLMLILQYNDEISEVKSVEDARKIMQNINKELEKLSSLVSSQFEKKDFEAAKDIVIQMKYYANISKSLKTKVQEMGLDV